MKLENLNEYISYPLIAKYKENGFLGLMSIVNGDVVLATKSTTQGDWKNYFQELWDRENANIKMYLQEFAVKENCTIIFEVKSFKDKHLIDFDKEELVILDVVKNSLKVNGVNIDINYSSKCLNEFKAYLEAYNNKIVRVVDTVAILNNFEDFKQLLEDYKYHAFEGFVFTDTKGFMFKWKSDFYNKWKRYRNILNLYKNNINQSFPYGRCSTAEEVFFAKFLSTLDKDFVLNANIIEIRKKYYEDK